ncbi:MAG: hypothetical protein Q8L48_16245 [Archangium sp.]|nr:hypothetical protein [Archangium sp.]
MTTKADAESQALHHWLEKSSDDDLVASSRALQAISQRVVVWAAVSALRALLDEASADPMVDGYHVERAGLLADAVEAWLADPSDERLSLVRQRTGGIECMWNELSGDTGQPEPVLAAATNTGWCVIHSGQLFNLTPALGEAERRLGPRRVIAAVRTALAVAPPWALSG